MNRFKSSWVRDNFRSFKHLTSQWLKLNSCFRLFHWNYTQYFAGSNYCLSITQSVCTSFSAKRDAIKPVFVWSAVWFYFCPVPGSAHVCIWISLKMNKTKVADSCVRWKQYQSLLSPEVPPAIFFVVLAGKSYFGVIYAAEFATRCEWVRVRVFICATRVYEIKHIKGVAWRNEWLLALQTGCLFSPPQRVREMSRF